MEYSKSLSRLLYSKYKCNENIPIECLVNICLLLNGNRKIIQFDKYWYNTSQWENIENLLKDILKEYINYPHENIHVDINLQWKYENEKLIKLFKRSTNYILYLDKIISYEIDKLGIDTVIDNYLDIKFYNCCKYDTNKCKNDIVRISFNVIGPVESGNVHNGEINLNQLKLSKEQNYFGQILLMECTQEEVQKNIDIIYKRFMDYKNYISKIDTNLQLSFELYTKYGIWENQPFLKVETLNYSA